MNKKEIDSINNIQNKLNKIEILIKGLDNSGKGYSGEWLRKEIELILKGVK